ncbi:MAG: acetate kinase [Candidatus Omnitrophica bacterium]|nr:acetate kinase [Candidatus Omnitrophota bacterium]
MNILVINCGSSSIKYDLFDMPSQKSLERGVIEHIGEKGSRIRDHYSGLKIILSRIAKVEGIGHRVVHGAEKFRKPVLVNNKVLSDIRACSKLAPLHNPANLEGIAACRRLLGSNIPQVAVFDTAFYFQLPEYAYIYALPYNLYANFGIRRYGFHGISHEYVAKKAALTLKKPLRSLNLITCHLGNGCSITAIKKGRAIDTSMGFTPLEGLVMGTRCGDIDPAIITYLARYKGWTLERIDQVLNRQSGLRGISGQSNDMRRLKAKAAKGNKRARLAIDIFVYRIRKYIGAYLAVMGGCDAIVFTGGMGENQKGIRNRICSKIFDNMKSRPRILVIPTREELMIARKIYDIINKKIT